MSSWVIEDVKFEADKINPGLSVSPWSGHRQFAYDLISFVKPKTVVELGTHYGCSFFAFLQACKDKGLESQIIAIDCWEGDEQAGFYGEEVWNTVNTTINKCFETLNFKLIRKYFQDAVSDIEDESVDIIHIDGLHTYDAVSQDFQQWLPKLKKNGIMLFHDVASKLGYGTNVFWKEICEKYPYHYTFEHSWGLGVLFPKGNEWYQCFERENMRDKILIYEYKSSYDLVNRQLQDHIAMVEARDKALKATETLVEERDEALKATEAMVKNRDEALKATETMVKERDEALRATETMVKERDEALKATEAMVKDRDEALKATEAMVKERDRALKATETLVEERDEALKKRDTLINVKDKVIQKKDLELDELRKQKILCEEREEKLAEELKQSQEYAVDLINRNLIQRIFNKF